MNHFLFVFLLLGALIASDSASALPAYTKVICQNIENKESFFIIFGDDSHPYVRVQGRQAIEGDEIRFYPKSQVKLSINENGNYLLEMLNYNQSAVLEALEFPYYLNFGGDGYGSYFDGASSFAIFCSLK